MSGGDEELLGRIYGSVCEKEDRDVIKYLMI